MRALPSRAERNAALRNNAMRTYDKLIAHIQMRRSADCLQPRFGVVGHGHVAKTHIRRASLQANT